MAVPGVLLRHGLDRRRHRAPPGRIDLLTEITVVEFEDAWNDRVQHRVESVDVAFLGKASLIKNKRATGRPKDLLDLESLENG